MSNLHDFLVWFDGWSENIEGQPTAKQWARLCAKVDEVRKAEPVPSPVPHAGGPVPAPSPPALAAPTNEREWKVAFMATLMDECGMDHESANDVWSDYKDSNGFDIARNARTEAMQASGVMN